MGAGAERGELPRPLTAAERHLVTWLLEHGEPRARIHLAEVPGLRVVRRCACGCASVDFTTDRRGAMDVLADFEYRDGAGRRFGVYLFASGGVLAGLDVGSVDGEATPTELPETTSLVPVRDG